MYVTDIYRTLHPKTIEYTFFSSAHGTFPRIRLYFRPQNKSINLRELKS